MPWCVRDCMILCIYVHTCGVKVVKYGTLATSCISRSTYDKIQYSYIGLMWLLHTTSDLTLTMVSLYHCDYYRPLAYLPVFCLGKEAILIPQVILVLSSDALAKRYIHERAGSDIDSS